MTDYKALKGKTIKNLASDLDNAEGAGEIWFNTTSSDFKTIAKAAGTCQRVVILTQLDMVVVWQVQHLLLVL